MCRAPGSAVGALGCEYLGGVAEELVPCCTWGRAIPEFGIEENE